MGKSGKRGKRSAFRALIRLLEWLSSGEARLRVVPPFYLVAFAQMPAEQHDAAIAQGRKVYQTACVIFELYAQSFKL